MTALRQVLAGEIYIGQQVTTKIISHVLGRRPSQGSGVERLTDRELEVFELLGRGRTTRQISTELNLGAATVETYRCRIKEKLQLENGVQLRSEAVRWVLRTQQVERSPGI